MLKKIRKLVSISKVLAVCERYHTDVVIIGVVYCVICDDGVFCSSVKVSRML